MTNVWHKAVISFHKDEDRCWHWYVRFYGVLWQNGFGKYTDNVVVKNNGSRKNKKLAMKDAKEFARCLHIPCQINKPWRND